MCNKYSVKVRNISILYKQFFPSISVIFKFNFKKNYSTRKIVPIVGIKYMISSRLNSFNYFFVKKCNKFNIHTDVQMLTRPTLVNLNSLTYRIGMVSKVHLRRFFYKLQNSRASVNKTKVECT